MITPVRIPGGTDLRLPTAVSNFKRFSGKVVRALSFGASVCITTVAGYKLFGSAYEAAFIDFSSFSAFMLVLGETTLASLSLTWLGRFGISRLWYRPMVMRAMRVDEKYISSLSNPADKAPLLQHIVGCGGRIADLTDDPFAGKVMDEISRRFAAQTIVSAPKTAPLAMVPAAPQFSGGDLLSIIRTGKKPQRFSAYLSIIRGGAVGDCEWLLAGAAGLVKPMFLSVEIKALADRIRDIALAKQVEEQKNKGGERGGAKIELDQKTKKLIEDIEKINSTTAENDRKLIAEKIRFFARKMAAKGKGIKIEAKDLEDLKKVLTNKLEKGTGLQADELALVKMALDALKQAESDRAEKASGGDGAGASGGSGQAQAAADSGGGGK